MSLTITTPQPQDITRKKYFYFDAVNKTTTDRLGIKAFTKSDTTAVSTTSTTRVTLKTYTYDTTGGLTPRKIRVRVYGRGASGYFYLRIDGVDVASGSTISGTTTVLVIDYVGDISPGSHTITIDAYTSSTANPAYVDKVYIIDAVAITSTTSVTVGSFSFDPSSEYVLSYSGDFKFEVGIRLKVVGYRKTTSTSSLKINNNDLVQTTLGSGDDGDSVTGINLGFLTLPLSTTTITLTGNVGASGDILWIISLIVQVTLRGNQVDSYGTSNAWTFIIRERGIGGFSCRFVSLSGMTHSMGLKVITKDGNKYEWVSGSGGDIIVDNKLFVNEFEKSLYINYGHGHDSLSLVAVLYLHVVVIT